MQAKRWLSGLVACAMLVTMLPTQVFALESDAADTWSKTLNAEELYALIQDKLDENGSIGLADLADSEAGTDTNDGVQGTLTAVAFDSGDKIELSALADGDTSYTLTFTDDDTSEPDSGLPAETGDMTEPPQEDGQPVAPGATPADDSIASDTTSGTDPPTAEEPSAQGQEGTVDLRVTTQETYATEAEADAQAAEQGKDPEADVAVQTDEATGTVLGALLTVDEKQVDKVTLTYTEIVAEDDAETQEEDPLAGLAEVESVDGYTQMTPSMFADMELPLDETLTGEDLAAMLSDAGSAAVQIGDKAYAFTADSGLTLDVDTENDQFTWNDEEVSLLVNLGMDLMRWTGNNEDRYIPDNAIPEDTSDGAAVVSTEKTASIPEGAIPGQWDITMTAKAEQDLTQQSQEVVLLLDTSGSMAWCTHEHTYSSGHDVHDWTDGGDWCGYPGETKDKDSRIAVAKEAATELIDTLAERGLNVKVAVTEFNGSSWTGGYASTVQRLSDLTPGNVEKLTEAIDKLKADGATYMFTGLQEAANAFSSNSTKKTIIMLADGDYNGQDPVPFAQALQRANVSIYTVGFMTDNDTLESIASDEEHYFTANDMDSLLKNFQTIANQLSAMINDPLGEDVSLVGAANDVKVSIGNNNASSEGVKYDEKDNLITWNPSKNETIQNRETVTMTYTVTPKEIQVTEPGDVQKIALNGDATFNYFYTDGEETTYDGSAPFDPPTGYYTAGQLVEKYVDENGKSIDGMPDQTSAPVIVSWGTEENNLEPSNAEFTWTTPTMPEGYVSVKTYKADNFEDIQEENLLTETSMTATAGTTTIYHVFSKEPVQKNSQIKVEVYLDGNTKAESNSSEYVNVYNTKNGIDTVVSRKEGNLYEFQYETYNSMDTKITLVKDSQYVIDAVETGVIKGETSFNADESYVKSTEAKIDNVAGTDLDNNVVTVYLRTKYSVAYYKDGEPLNNYEDNTIYVAAREAGAKTSYNDYTTSEDNNKSPLSTKVQSAGLSTTISLKDLPEVGTDKTISGWFATEIVQPDEVKYQGNTNVSEHANRAKAGVIPFYARTADATATLTVQAVNEEGEPLTVDDQLPKSVQVTIGEPYTVVIGTSTDATITAPMTFTVDGTHYAYMELGENSAALMGTMPADGATVTLVYGVDEIGGEDGGPDGIPDAYQAMVMYKVVNGTWDGTDVADKTEVVDLYKWIESTNMWELISNPTLQNVPTGMIADPGYLQSSGKWDKVPTAVDLQPGGTATFTYAFTDTVKKITSVEKELLKGKPEDLTLPEGITLPAYDAAKGYFTVDADATQVSLLYQITVEGDAGAEFTLTDTPAGENTTIQYWNGASWSNKVISDTLADTLATYYVLVTYTPDFTNGVAMIGANTVTVTSGNDDTTTVPEEPTDSTDSTEVRKNFTVTYQFVSDTDGKTLPEKVMALLPTEQTVTAGETVTLADPADMQVDVDDGMWLFRFWNSDTQTTSVEITGNTTFVGHWEFASDMFTLDSVLAHFQKQLIVNGKNDLGGGRIFAFKLTAENGASLTKNIFAEAKLNSDGTVTVPLTTTETSVFLPVGTYTLTEYAAADDRDQGTWNLADSVTFTLSMGEDYQPVITINGSKLAENEVYTFTNTYTGPQIGIEEEPDPSDPTAQKPTKTPVTKLPGVDNLTMVEKDIWNALSAQTVWPVQDADNWSLTVPAGEESTTYVLYDVAINGDIGAEFTVTDEDATLVAYQGAALSADNSYYTLDKETAHFYFAKKADQTENGILENVAIVTDKNNPGEEPGGEDPVPDPEAPDIPVITEGVTAEKHVVTKPAGISLKGVNVKYPDDNGTVTISEADDENAVLLYAVTVKGAANANFTLTEEPYVVYIPSDDGTTLTPNGNGNTYTGTLPADGEATFYFTKPITGEGKMKNTVVLNDDTSNPIESGETEIIETVDPTDPENPGYVTITFYEGNHGTLSKDTDDNGVYTVTIKRGSSLTQSNLTDVLADPGYYFTGWQNANVTYSESELLVRTFDTDTAFTAQYQTMPNQIIVNYDDDGSGYGEITSEHRQVFTADNWQTIAGDPTHVWIHLTATAEDDGGRTYFDEWQGSLVDDLDDDIREDEDLDVGVVAEIGQTYTVIADFGRRSSGGGGGGGNRDDDDDEEEIIDEEVPLAETPWLNTVDHYAYIVGYAEDGTVRPNANITRAEVATIFFRLLTDEARNSLWSTTNTFSDVASTAWYNTAVSTMANAGIIQGYEDGTFRPNANITRAEFAAIAARFMTSGYDVESDLFTDIAGHWARESINDAATAGWINGYSDDTFRPDNAITRAEAVTLVNNVLQRKPDADHMLDSMITWPDNPESAWYYEAIQEATNSHDYDMPSEDDDVDYETWTALQENRDWAALEAQWSAEHAYGGDVM